MIYSLLTTDSLSNYMFVIWSIYAILVAAIIGLSIYLSYLTNLLDKKTNISGALIGGLLLGSITSAPELITSISSIFLNSTGDGGTVVFGNILGSDIFNICILALVLVIFSYGFKNVSIDKNNILTISLIIICYAIGIYAIAAPESIQPMIGGFNFMSLFIFIAYVIFIFVLFRTNNLSKKNNHKIGEVKDSLHTSKLKLKWIILIYVIVAIILIGVSVGLAFTTDVIMTEYNFEPSSVGAIMLGVITSMPELVSTIALCKMKNYNVAISQITGTNIFNFFILFIANIFCATIGETVFIHSASTMNLSILGIIATFAFLIVLLISINRKNSTKKWFSPIFITANLIVFSFFIGYLVSIAFPGTLFS